MLTLGDRGYNVALMQQFISNHGFKTMVDGYFDVKTKKALLDFQKKLGVDPTGVWEDSLYDHYRALFGDDPDGLSLRDVNSSTTTTTTDDSPVDSGQGTTGSNQGTTGNKDVSKDAASKGEKSANTDVPPDTYAWEGPSFTDIEAYARTHQGGQDKYPNGQTLRDLYSQYQDVSWKENLKDGSVVIPDNANGKAGDLLKPVKDASRLMRVYIEPTHDPGNRVTFYGIPEELSDNNTANFVPIAVKGRSAPFQDYENSGPRQVSFNILIHMEYCPGRKIRPVISSIRSFTYPRKVQNIKPIIVNFFAGNIAMKAIVNSVNVTWKKPIIDQWYCMAEVSINMTEVVDHTVYYDQVKKLDKWTQ